MDREVCSGLEDRARDLGQRPGTSGEVGVRVVTRLHDRNRLRLHCWKSSVPDG